MQVTVNPNLCAHYCIDGQDQDDAICTGLVLGNQLFQVILLTDRLKDMVGTDIYLFPMGATLLDVYINKQGEYLLTGVGSVLSNARRVISTDTLGTHNYVVQLFTDLLVADDRGLLKRIKTDLSCLYKRL